MASALVKGIVDKVVPPESIIASDVYDKCLSKLAEDLPGVKTTQDNLEVVNQSDMIVLAVKPQVMASVLAQVAPAVRPDQTFVSIAAGVTLEALQQGLGESARVVRVMPNTPCLVGEAASGFALGPNCADRDRDRVQALLSAVGVAVETQEKLLDAVTGLSGSGPAYVFLMMEALADGGVRAGLPRPLAMQLAAQTVRGAATMQQTTGLHPGVLKDQVCSPGGTTIAGVEALEAGKFRHTVMSAVVSATNRATELSKPTDK
eukprot:CAMPEP_0113937680 /NCGR_PEP_ID=MMETSP1339-20121228/4243_1 /TAXON_ID=94617 /ORGANISM="Fibrocapsa japonica" /LENGTH=260 /DNA_ID=CAMNT_0000940531 /DNA_START=193 /DNA_END=975 /DNA_ORIENTATION=+ /assembly_acc=CAM_ASM_000762